MKIHTERKETKPPQLRLRNITTTNQRRFIRIWLNLENTLTFHIKHYEILPDVELTLITVAMWRSPQTPTLHPFPAHTKGFQTARWLPGFTKIGGKALTHFCKARISDLRCLSYQHSYTVHTHIHPHRRLHWLWSFAADQNITGQAAKSLGF